MFSRLMASAVGGVDRGSNSLVNVELNVPIVMCAFVNPNKSKNKRYINKNKNSCETSYAKHILAGSSRTSRTGEKSS